LPYNANNFAIQTNLQYFSEDFVENLKRLRFLAMNYSRLQGLKNVPLGLLLILLSVWANTLRKPATDLTLPVLSVIVCGALYLAVDRYYAHTFGQVQRTSQKIHFERLTEIAGGVLALGAFVTDVSVKLPVSTLGLVFAALFLAEYLLLTRFTRERYLLYYPVIIVLTVGVTLSPLLANTIGGSHGYEEPRVQQL
jgi:hypothetical protein